MTEEKKELTELGKKCIEESLQRNNLQNNNFIRISEGLPTIEEKKAEEARIELSKIYEDIKEQYADWLDIPEDIKIINSLWIIGTYMHKDFNSFPYLFFNAMKSSGKTRMLKLTTAMAWQGQLLASLTESVLFRSQGTLGIDEFESIGGKEKQALRELLNAGYKKGIIIKRMKKVTKKNEFGLKEETHEAEPFEAYRPIIMANIWGMDEVVQDRCISVILDKSNNPRFTKLIEDFENNPKILSIKERLSQIQCSLCSVVMQKECILGWNNYIRYKNYTTTHNTFTTLNYTNYTEKEIVKDDFYLKIDNSGIDGRHLELFMPLFVIAKGIDYKLFEEILAIAKKLSEDKKVDEITESKDVMLLDFISRLDIEIGEFHKIDDLVRKFREHTGSGDDYEHDKWLNNRWLGRALKRLNLIMEKKRMGTGMEVVINKAKAEEKMKIFHK